MSESLDDIFLGLEMAELTQKDIVSEFRDLVAHDVGAAVTQYDAFVGRLEHATSEGNAQVRSLVGGPDARCRADLITIMAGSYETASDDVKARIRDEAVRPLLRDNSFYIKLAVATMTNPYLIGDIIREHPSVNPGANYYERDLKEAGALRHRGELQQWLDRLGNSMFAATTMALQQPHENVVSEVVVDNEVTFRAAAHVIAATHDLYAEIAVLRGSTTPKTELVEAYRTDFVEIFADMVKDESRQAAWLPLGQKIIELYSLR